MSNRVQNPSFEAGLDSWEFSNVNVVDTNPFEGTASARMGPGVASIFQDIRIRGCDYKPSFLLSFAIQAPLSPEPGNLTVKVQWLDVNNLDIGIGLSMVIPSNTTGLQLIWLTYVDVTESAPTSAKKARILFSKAEGTGPNDVLDIDRVVFTDLDVGKKKVMKCQGDCTDKESNIVAASQE